MGNMNESRLGQVLGSGDAQALFLKVFSAEVLTAFEEKNVMMPLHTVRTITSGKSAQFPMTGKATAGYHVPGDEILGNAINHAERVISIDNLLVSSAFIANIDEAMNHYDVRSIYSRELGYALANHCDRAVIRSGIAGSLDQTDAIGNSLGTDGTQTLASNDAAGLVAKLVATAQLFDERDVPDTDRYAIITPEMFYLLVAAAGSSGLSSAIFNNDFDGTGSINQGRQTLQIAGMTVMMSNHIPAGDEGTATGALGDGTDGVRNDPFVDAGATGASAGEGYSGIDFQKYCGLAFHRSGIGTVKLLDLAMESEYLVQNQGTLMVAKYAMGHNFLRAQACVGLKKA